MQSILSVTDVSEGNYQQRQTLAERNSKENKSISVMASEHNPFSGLLQESPTTNNRPDDNQSVDRQQLSDFIENVFLFTINNNVRAAKHFVYMEEIATQVSGDKLLDLELLEQALFERLLLSNPRDYLISGNNDDERAINQAAETQVITYLCRAFIECERFRENVENAPYAEACNRINELIMRNAVTSITQPSLYEGQSLSDQWLNILNTDGDEEYKQKFLSSTVKEVCTDDELASMGSLKAIFYPMFNEIQKVLASVNLVTQPRWLIQFFLYFVQDNTVPQLGEMLLDYSTPNPDAKGKAYGDTLLGQLLTLSILPKNNNGPYDFYGNLAETVSIIDNLSSYLSKHQDNVFTIFRMLIRLGTPIKNKVMTWIAKCLHANAARGQLWTIHNLTTLSNSASDAFMFGLCSVLLRLCVPLCKPSYKVLLVDPTYCATPEEECAAKEVRLPKAWEETCLLPVENNEKRATAAMYNFVTELFFMTHKAIELSYRVCIARFMRIRREVQNTQSAHLDALAQGNTIVANTIMSLLETQTQQFICLKNTIFNPENDAYLFKFFDATAQWLLNVNVKSKEEYDAMVAAKSFSPKQTVDVSLPLPSYVPPYLASIPESIIENIIVYMNFFRRFETTIGFFFEGPNTFFKMILAFMGNAKRMKNPHLRAKLAEGLESLLPKDRQTMATDPFTTHPDRLHVVPNLLEVFVSIEMTGQSVQFEQKFNYRRPMYAIMEFLWALDEQKKCFKALAIEAEQNMEAVEPPLFLRFLNLLINDAIFLLDDSLSNLQQIRQLQAAQDKGEWNELSANERQQNLANLQHLGMMAKFGNILSRDTINILKLISSEIKAIFSHHSMVDRIASMLNYFLLNLVGPNKSKFKVKAKDELNFDPAHTVLEICRIYINLSPCDSFCLAVSQDGRSYSSSLFEYAEAVLIRIGRGQLIDEMSEFAAKVRNLDKKHKADQEALINPPDEYLDPIMSSLMTDPVILPSSRVTVDRSTIARHLLSDQTDPFNRSPLTMDQVQPNIELKAEIDNWIEQKRKEYSEGSNENVEESNEQEEPQQQPQQQ